MNFQRLYSLAVVTAGCFILWIALVIIYHKFDSTWWGISIWWFAILLILGAIGIVAHYKQFNHQVATPKFLLYGLLFYVFFSLVTGIVMTESSPGQVQSGPSGYNYSHTHAGAIFTGIGKNSSTEDSHSTENASGEGFHGGKGAGYLLIFLLILALLFASAIFPHFWVIGSLMVLILLSLLIFKEYRRAAFRVHMLEERKMRKLQKKEKSREKRERKQRNFDDNQKRLHQRRHFSQLKH